MCEIVHNVYYQETNLIEFEHCYYLFHKKGDKGRHKEPQTYQPPV